MIEVGSDFSGVGAFDQALKRLNIDYKTRFACDIDLYARETYMANYGEPVYFPFDVYDREIPERSLTIYMTSPPCQSFSLAGKRKGEDDKRGTLFYNSHEFIKQNKPRYFIFENVKGLLSDDKGKTFRRWLDFLGGKSVNGNTVIFPHEESVPYHIYHKVLNAKHYGVPQNRERVFIIGIRDDADNDFTFPKPFPLVKRLKDVLEENVDEKYYLSERMVNWITSHRNKRDSGNTFPMNENQESQCVTARYYKMGAEDPYVKVESVTKIRDGEINKTQYGKHQQDAIYETENSIAPTLLSSGDGHMGGAASGYLKYRVKSATKKGYEVATEEYITSVKKNALITNKIRRLTPRECFRLMDFPDTFKIDQVSNTQAYKQAGNSIVVNVLVEILNKLKL